MILLTILSTLISWSLAQPRVLMPDTAPCQPDSAVNVEPAFIKDPLSGVVSQDFCAEWNPDFAGFGYQCCSEKALPQRRGKRLCPKYRATGNYCRERTPEQIEFEKKVREKKFGDYLSYLEFERGRKGRQSYCTGGNGFVAHGRPIVGTPENRIHVMSDSRCVNYGTDELVLVLEWIGREIAKKYSAPEYQGVKLLVADASAPRGGCLTGRRGRRSHASHTSGRDVDIGFLSVRKNGASDVHFQRKLDYEIAAWFLKTLFRNPYACIDVVFLDKSHQKKLAKYFKDDPEWNEIRPRVQHVRGHRDHFHIRVGFNPGKPGCPAEMRDEMEEDWTDLDPVPGEKTDEKEEGDSP